MTTEEKPIIKEIVKAVIKREFPYNAASYQFKHLEDARTFSRELAAIPRSGHKHLVMMACRNVQGVSSQDGKVLLITPIMVDVTSQDPVKAESEKLQRMGVHQ